MCHQKERVQNIKYKKATVLDIEGYFYNPVKVVLPAESGRVRVYGKSVPNGAALIRYNAVFAKDGRQVL